MTSKKSPLLGILGGLGPMSSAYFYEMLTAHTKAEKDQDHIDIVISSRATTPDRTDFILGRSDENPLPVMIEEAEKLVAYGVDLIAIPCNTAHYFYDELTSRVDVPFVNIIEETALRLRSEGIGKVGLLATEGTAKSGAYNHVCERHGIECMLPSDAMQKRLHGIIYGQIKEGKRADMELFRAVSDELFAMGCEKLILGCTELSLIKRDEKLDGRYLDALEVLAYSTILKCGKTPIGLF